MKIAEIQVSGTKAGVAYRTAIPAGLIGGYISVQYTDPSWVKLIKTVVFRGAQTRDVVTNSDVVRIPTETIAVGKELYVGFYGTDTNGTVAIPTVWANLGVVVEAANPSGDESTDPSLPVWAQLAQRVEDLEKYGTGSSGGGTGGSAEGAVLYTAQKLNDDQKAQARENIQAADANLLDTILEDVPLKNILPPDYVMGYWNGDEFTVTDSLSSSANLIPVTGGVKLYVTWADSTNAVAEKLFLVTYFDENGERISSESSYFGSDRDSDTRKYINVPANCTHIHFSLSEYKSGMRLADMCVSYSAVNSYVPYEAPGKKVVKTNALNESARNILSPLYGKIVVNLGDSIYGSVRPPDDISTELAKLTGATVYNCGFGGTQMSESWNADYNTFCFCNLAEAIASGDWTAQDAAAQNIAASSSALRYFIDAKETLKNLDYSKVEVITIAYGANDFMESDVLDREYSLIDKETYAGALRYGIERLLTAFPNLKLYICSPIYRFWTENGEFSEDSDTYLNLREHKLTDFVAKTEAVAKEYHLPYIDCYYSLGFNKLTRTRYFSPTDGTHPVTAGCHLMAAHMAKALF